MSGTTDRPTTPPIPPLPAGVSLVEGEGGLPVVRVATAAATSDVYLHGGHVATWRPAGADPVLWLSPRSRFAAGSAIRGGVPVCHPWFADGQRGDLTPMHGLVRTVTWRLAEVTAQGEGRARVVTLALEVTGQDVADQLGEDALEHAPTGLAARLVVHVGETLTLALTATNPGTEATEVEQALHTYLAVGDVARVRLRGLDGAEYLDKDAGVPGRQVGDLVVTGPTDRVYDSGADLRLEDPVLGRVVSITPHEARSTVVWNPAEDRPSLCDVPPGGWSGFLCVETADVGRHARVLRPGEHHTTAVTYAVGSLDRS